MAPDENRNLIPDKWDPLAAAIYMIVSGAITTVMLAMAPKVPMWITIAAGIVSQLGGIFKFGLVGKAKGENK